MGAVAQLAQARDMVGMQMGVYRLDQFEIELAQELAVAVGLFQDGIENHGLAASAAREQIAVGAGHAVEELAEDHFDSSSNESQYHNNVVAAAHGSSCHCERSEAIQSLTRGSGLLRRFAPRNVGGCLTR